MTVGERLRFVRKVRGMPQHELASKVSGIPRTLRTNRNRSPTVMSMPLFL